MNYFDIEALSNSDMGVLRQEIYGIEENKDLAFHYAFGSLVDAILTELNEVKIQVMNSYPFTQQDIDRAHHMSIHCLKDPLIKMLLPVSKGQYIFVKTLNIQYNEYIFRQKCKCKFDLLAKKYDMGLDFKTVSAETQKQFIDSVMHFNWDRQGAFYMDLAEINRHWIYGISKKNSKIFKLAMSRGDDYYDSGKQKYEYWSYKYHTLISNF